jgi:hypothetical protein
MSVMNTARAGHWNGGAVGQGEPAAVRLKWLRSSAVSGIR